MEVESVVSDIHIVSCFGSSVYRRWGRIILSVSEDKQKGICITVRDNGVGIKAAEQAELFTRYYRGTNTKEKPEGSGLGLAIAKQRL